MSPYTRQEIEQDTNGALMLAGQPYNTFSRTLMQAREQAKKLCGEFNQRGDSAHLHTLLPNAAGLVATPPFYCDYGSLIYCQGMARFDTDCVILDGAEVRIGNNVQVEAGVTIATVTHDKNSKRRIKGWQIAAPVHIGDNVRIQEGAAILPGAVIPAGTIVAAGSVWHRNGPIAPAK